MKRYSEIISTILFCLIIISFAVVFVLMPDKDFSEQENRNLASFPEFNSDRFFSGEFANDINVYFADQFPLRDMFVKLKSASELALFKGENNGVLYSENQLAVKDFDAYRSIRETVEDTDRIFTDSIKAQLQNIEKLGKTLDVPLVTVLPPRTIDITDSVFSYDRPDGDNAFDLMNETLMNSGYIDILDDMRERYDEGEYVYYRTDHHWTTLGAYYTYRDIMKSLGKEDKIIPIEDFDIEKTENFSGTTAARANFPFYKKDTLEIWCLDDEDQYEITADGEVLNGFYNRDYLDTSDKYSVFLDGTHNITTITKKGVERETLFIVKDSFANCLIPFLAREYNIVAVNIHVINAITATAKSYNADAVLIVCNTENIITTGDLGKLK